MIVLDTNVLPELMKQAPAPQVVDWLDSFPTGQVFVTSITTAEILYGIARLPSGQRKTAFAVKINTLLTRLFGGQVLAFTGEAAVEYAELVSSRERQGLPISVPDAQIAAICRLHGADIATRNVKDFAETGLRIIDPWID